MEDDASICIVDVISGDQRIALESMGVPVEFGPDETIFREGQPSHSVLIIQRGNVKITKKGADDAEVILAIRGSTEIMGDEGVLMGEVRSATVTTITEVVGLDVRAEDLLRFVDEQRLWPVMYRAAVHRRRQSDQRALLGRLDVRSRLARWLFELVGEVGEQTDAGWVISAALSQQDIAGRIAASRDAVAIELRKLRESGLVETGRKRIVIRDLEAIRGIAAR